METEQEARDITNKRVQLQREQSLRTTTKLGLDELSHRIALGEFHELNIIVKGDTDGSIEALSDSFIKLSTEKVQVNVISKAVGQISENDVMLASASQAIIDALKRYKDDAKEVATGLECGISLVNWGDIEVGDIIETFTEIEVEQKL